jgi:hypothetical protein
MLKRIGCVLFDVISAVGGLRRRRSNGREDAVADLYVDD